MWRRKLVTDELSSGPHSGLPTSMTIIPGVICGRWFCSGFAAKAYIVSNPVGFVFEDIAKPCLITTKFGGDKPPSSHTIPCSNVQGLHDDLKNRIDCLFN